MSSTGEADFALWAGQGARSEGSVCRVTKPSGARRCVTYGQLAEKLESISVRENERNLNNKISRGGFTAAFLIQCLEAIGCHTVRLGED
jgi:Domain of unknown function (DUF6471)